MSHIKKNKIELYLSSNNNRHNKNKVNKLGDIFESLEEKVYKIVKNKIIYHEFKPGERVLDKNIAEQLSVSRSLVRQVFATLVKEEFLVLVPRNGFYIRENTEKEVKEIYNIRKILESYATTLAVPKIHKKDINELEKLFEKAKKDLDENNAISFIETDAQLHRLLIDNSGNEYLITMINKYNDKFAFYRAVDLNRIERAKESYFEHYEVFQAVKEKKEVLAAKLMAEHVEKSKNVILENFKEYNYGHRG